MGNRRTRGGATSRDGKGTGAPLNGLSGSRWDQALSVVSGRFRPHSRCWMSCRSGPSGWLMKQSSRVQRREKAVAVAVLCAPSCFQVDCNRHTNYIVALPSGARMTIRLFAVIALVGVGILEPYPSVTASRHAASVTESAVLLVRVVEATSGQPLPNAEIIDLDASSHRFTNCDGEARIAGPIAAGYGSVCVSSASSSRIASSCVLPTPPRRCRHCDVHALARRLYALPTWPLARAASAPRTATPRPEHWRPSRWGSFAMSAERYESFRKAYPFRIKQKRRTIHFNRNGSARDVREGTEDETSTRVGRTIPARRRHRSPPNGFSVPLLFLSALADSVFWEHHCFAVRGVETLLDGRVLRLDFEPALSVSTVDWMGTAFVDSATSVLRARRSSNWSDCNRRRRGSPARGLHDVSLAVTVHRRSRFDGRRCGGVGRQRDTSGHGTGPIRSSCSRCSPSRMVSESRRRVMTGGGVRRSSTTMAL